MAFILLFLMKYLHEEEKMITPNFFMESDEERVKQLAGIANLHISIARELMGSERPLSREEMQSLLELLITANEAKHLAYNLKNSHEIMETA